MRRFVAALVVLALLPAPSGAAQTLQEQFQDLRFARLVFTVGWDTERERGNVLVSAEDLVIRGEGASDLRHCIDGGDCPMPDLRMAASGANRDGQVSSGEAQNFADNLKVGLSLYEDFQEIQRNLRGLIKIDDQSATSAPLTGLRLDGATGPVTSTTPIRISITITVFYATTTSASQHNIWMQRTESDLTIADQIVVQAARDWRIKEDSIQPSAMQARFSDDKLVGSQQDFESRDPLTFTIEERPSGPSGWMLWLSILAVVGAAAGAGIYIMRRKL
jgi:hypothetical protein